MEKLLDANWFVLQDVHDTAEALRLQEGGIDLTGVGHQLSEWEPIDRLEHLQVLLAGNPYWGRELRYFNHAPWWYLNEFDMPPGGPGARTTLRFTNVDYFCRVWLNGVHLGDHEGYSIPFEFDVTDALRTGAPNRLVVKVWSPWDSAVRGDAFAKRTFQVIRNLVKGTYEHDDTFVARDVNPVGIYGTVSLTTTVGPRFEDRPRVSYRLSEDRTTALVTVRGTVSHPGAASADMQVHLRHETALKDAGSFRFAIPTKEAGGAFEVTFAVGAVETWNTWDQGDQPLYRLRMSLAGGETQDRRIAFRTVTLERDPERTVFFLNGRRFFVRGTSYFPDVYISTMTRERYRRDLHAIKAAGFNFLRIHVHVEKQEFYELCDELGIAVIQDSEYNWTHPIAEEWAGRLISIFERTILMLDDHPSLIAWICLNEPGVFDPEGRTHGYAMEISPGPRLYGAVTALDPSRPAIKGSYCDDDPTSGDSHNYTGSLQGPDTPYTAIDGTTEKLNTEFGFDAPGSIANLRKVERVFSRLSARLDAVGEAQEYQYRLIKYYIEHYRTQKYRPCSGYVHFMFVDLCPQSFYGVYDWWGTPKRGLDALLESNQPVAVFIEQSAGVARAVWLVNDTHRDLGPVAVTWQIADDKGSTLAAGSATVACGPDCGLRVAELALSAAETASPVDAAVVARGGDGRIVAINRYRDMFDHPAHVKGHPTRMNHEIGFRLYTA